MMSAVRNDVHKCFARSLLLVVWAMVAVDCEPGDLNAADWPQFLGPQRNGISSETGLLKSWPQTGPKEVWRASGGVGMSGLAVSQGQLVTLLQKGGSQFVVALDATTGKPRWQSEIGVEYRNQMGNGPRATPTIVDDMIYTLSGEGILSCWKTKNGDKVWQIDTLGELRGKVVEYGMACSPLVLGNLVVVMVGAPRATVVAYDRTSGKLAWKAGEDPAGYSSPTLFEIGGKKQVVVFTGNSALGLAPETGEQLWRYSYATDFNCNTATPLAFKDRVFISSGENHGAALLTLKSTGTKFDVAEKWTSHGARSVMRNEWQTSILLGGYLYGFDNVGGAGPVTHLNCVDVETGERVWQETRFGKANMIAADGKLFIVTMKGELVAIHATPDKFDEIGRKVVIGSTRQAPSLAGGLLYLRDDQEIVCLDVRE